MDVPQLPGPDEGPFHSPDEIVAVILTNPLEAGVQPLLDVEWLQVAEPLLRPKVLGKRVQWIGVKVVGAGRAVRLLPAQEFLAKVNYQGIRLGKGGSVDPSLSHQLVVLVPCRLFVGTETELVAVQFDVPSVAGLLEKGLGLTHGADLRAVEKSTFFCRQSRRKPYTFPYKARKSPPCNRRKSLPRKEWALLGSNQ